MFVDLPANGLGIALVYVGDRHVRPIARQRVRDGASDPPSTPRHDGNLVSNVHICSSD